MAIAWTSNVLLPTSNIDAGLGSIGSFADILLRLITVTSISATKVWLRFIASTAFLPTQKGNISKIGTVAREL